MERSIPNYSQDINSRSSVVGNQTSDHTLNLPTHNDFLSKMLNAQIAANIESYVRTISKMEMEIIKYLNYYFKKWDGCIAIPVKNLMDRFKCSQSWIEKLLRRLYDKGMLITTKGGYGRKVTKRTFTERAKIIMKAVTKGFGAVKQDIPKKSTDYCTDYSGDHTKYISSKVDILQNNPSSNTEKPKTEDVKQHLEAMRKLLNERHNC